MRIKPLLLCISIVLLSGCIGYQVVKDYELNSEGELICARKLTAFIGGTSGQKARTSSGIELEKYDTSNVFADLLRDGVAAGIGAQK